MPDSTYQAGVYNDQGGNREVIGPNGVLLMDGGKFLTNNGNGTVTALPGAGTLAVENRNHSVHKDVFTFTGVVLATVDGTTNGAQASFKVITLPRGNILIRGAMANLAIVGDGTGVIATAAVVGSIGTVAAAADATLTSTEANLIASKTCTLTGSAGTMKGINTAQTFFDNTTTTNSTQLAVYLNFAMPDASSTANGTLTVTGTIELTWENLGDN